MDKIGVVGCGLMGSGIAEVSARAGFDVMVVESDVGALEFGRQRVERSLSTALAKGKVTDAEHAAALAALQWSIDLDDMADRDLVVEAVAESESVKNDVFRHLDAVVKSPDAVLASNTSSIPIMRLGHVTNRPEQVVGVHFFNPVPVMRLVEVVSSLATSPETRQLAVDFGERLGKTVIHSKDRAGFIVNALLVPFLSDAIRMLESGFASAEDIDHGMVNGCNHPMGPLRLADQIGLDVVRAVLESMHEELGEVRYTPPALLKRMVDAGYLGRKSGRGFYTYEG